MKNIIMSALLVAQGWAHIWYVILSQRLIEYKDEMGWTGESWILSSLLGEPVTRHVSTLGYSLSLIGFILGGASLYMGKGWARTIILVSAAVSSATIATFWDGELSMLKEKGLIGLMINLAVIVYFTRLK
jgi:hypothetical protein